ncbi:hypothetical protein [uncultured Gordonia sp.]|uniref:hypothetical protein n=1 Tax=uncultured Gordonia sp. TaxID=198437 RepID=UPI00261E316D|nr:hypothetical protein [uncultured Gordonia sp.]
MSDSMLTTTDNPFSPFTQWDEWLAFDTRMGYGTLNYLARITLTSDALSPADQDLAVELAIDEIVEMNINGLYIKVVREGSEEKAVEPIKEEEVLTPEAS